MDIREQFEVHITIDDNHDILLYGFVQNFKQQNDAAIASGVNGCFIKPRVVYARALYGKYPKQIMFTGCISGTFDEVKKKVLLLADDMREVGINIWRVKIEGLASSAYASTIHRSYFESHFKVRTENTGQWNEIVKHVIGLGGHLSYNVNDRVPHPIITYRLYTSADELSTITYDTINYIRDVLGLEILNNPHFECALYDDNVFVDDGWTFDGTIDNVKKSLEPTMLF